MFHKIGPQFDACNGNNVLCMAPTVDLQRTYRTTFDRTEYVKSFMSVGSFSLTRVFH
jgi:hypothetical protein